MASAVGANCEGLLVLLHPNAVLGRHFGPGGNGAPSTPTWVWGSQDAPILRHLSERWQVPVLTDDEHEGIEDTHTTKWGPPGVVPGAVINLRAEVVNGGRVLQSQQWTGGPTLGYTGTATAVTSTSVTATATPWVAHAYKGYRCVFTTTGVWGNIEDNTTSGLTIDRWYTPSNPGGSAGSTPGNTETFTIPDGGCTSAWFMGITQNSSAVVDTDTSLTGEITTSGGGLVRKIGTYALTSGVHPAAWTLTVVYTGNPSDSYPAIIAKCAEFISMVPAWTAAPAMAVETLLTTTATVNASGQQLTITDTYAGA